MKKWTAIFAVLGIHGAAQAAPLVDFEEAAGIVAGTACSSETHALEGRNNVLRLVDGGIVLDLSDRWSPDADRASCTIRVPAVVPAGYYVSGLETITAIASDNTGTASVAFTPKVGDADLDVVTLDLPRGRKVSYLRGLQSTAETRRSLCNGRANEIMVGGNFAITGRKTSSTQKVFVAIGDWNWENVGADLFRLQLARCP